MKLKIMLLILLCFSVGIAQQKDKKEKKDKGKWEELIKYPTPIEPIQPEYPQVAKLAGIQGKVFVEALVDRNGNVLETKILKSDHESLVGAALAAVKTTKFYPAVSKENNKVNAWVVIPMFFKLDEKDKNSKKTSVGVNNTNEEVIDLDANAPTAVEKLPEIVAAATPTYPEIAKKAGITGKVFAKVLVDKEGIVKKAIIMKSDSHLFNESTLEAARKTKFSPARQNGKPIAVWIVLPYSFVLDGVKDKNEREYFIVLIVSPNSENYPKEAIEKKIEGNVLVKVYLEESTGKLEKTEIYKSVNEILNKAAVEELKKNWTSTYRSNKRSLIRARAKGIGVPADADIKSGSIICVHYDLQGFEQYDNIYSENIYPHNSIFPKGADEEGEGATIKLFVFFNESTGAFIKATSKDIPNFNKFAKASELYMAQNFDRIYKRIKKDESDFQKGNSPIPEDKKFKSGSIYTLVFNRRWNEDYCTNVVVNSEEQEYPKEALVKKVEGQVLLEVFIDNVTGKLTKTEIIESDNESLNESAMSILSARWEKIYEGNKKYFKEAVEKGKRPLSYVEIKSGSLINIVFQIKN